MEQSQGESLRCSDVPNGEELTLSSQLSRLYHLERPVHLRSLERQAKVSLDESGEPMDRQLTSDTRPFTRDVVQAMQMRIDSLESELASMHLQRGTEMPAGGSFRDGHVGFRRSLIFSPSSQVFNSTVDPLSPLVTSQSMLSKEVSPSTLT